MAVALHDLGGHRIHRQAEPGADILFDLGRHVGVGADRAGDLADGDLVAGGLQAVALAAQFVEPAEPA